MKYVIFRKKLRKWDYKVYSCNYIWYNEHVTSRYKRRDENDRYKYGGTFKRS